MSVTGTVSLYAVGDTAVSRANPESAFEPTLSVLNEPDILFGQLEVSLSQKGSQTPAALSAQRGHPRIASVLKSAGFDIMSFASNHTLDWGVESLLDTIDIARKTGITLIGVGKNITEARRPAILERKGVKIAFLAYNCILPPRYWATEDTAGCAPIRVRTFYEQIEPYQPGTPPEVHTIAYREDVEAMLADIRKARSAADIVIMSIHWGIHFMPARLAMYQREVGHAAIDAGVDLILGHHPHIMKGIEAYKGKVIFYSMGNFVMDSQATKTWPVKPPRRQLYEKQYGFMIDLDWAATYPYPADSRKVVLAKCLISEKKVQRVSFRPLMIRKPNQPEVLSSGETDFAEVVKYVQWLCDSQELGTKFVQEGDEMVVST